MKNLKQLFHAISYLQYPLILIAVVYAVLPFIQGLDTLWPSINKALIFVGLAVSFSTLQDTTRSQNEFSRKIWQDPRKGRQAVLVIALSTLVMLAVGTYGVYLAPEGIVREVAFGMLMLGVGYMGLLKAAIEMHEHHRIESGIAQDAGA